MDAILSAYHVASDGSVELVAANLPYSNLQWNRSLSTCGTFSAQLVGSLPLSWPGRYLVVRSDRPEVGVLEKVEASEDDGGVTASMSGRFAECLLDRRAFGPDGGSVSGADWRQAVTQAFATWPMPDAPAISMGDGTAAKTGSSYAIRVDAGKTGMANVYSVASANGAYPTLSLDWEAGDLELSIVDGLDRTRSQSDRPVCVFSLDMATATSTSYSGDYSVSCSEVLAWAKAPSQDAVAVTSEVAVPGFDAETMWQGVAAEDVSTLCSDSPTATEAASAGRLRTYDHMPALSIEMDPMGSGYGSWWDLGDTCEADVPAAGVSCSARIEEVREVVKTDGATLEVSLGTKRISRAARTYMRLR
jgi:hypothetical protein